MSGVRASSSTGLIDSALANDATLRRRWQFIAVVLAAVLMAVTPVASATAVEEAPATGSISGRISDSRGPDVPLFLPWKLNIGTADESGFTGIPIQINPDGSYTIDELPPGEYFVELRNYHAPAYLNEFYGGSADVAGATPVTVVAGQDTSNIDIELDLIAVATGSVLGGDGEPIQSTGSLFVHMFDQAGNLAGKAEVNDGPGPGAYFVSDLPTGRYYVGFVALDCSHRPQFMGGTNTWANATAVEIQAGTIVELPDVQLTANTAECAPEAPETAPILTAQGSASTVTWDYPAVEGLPEPTGFVVSSLPAGAGCVTTGAHECEVSGAQAGVDYRFFVSATNDGGTSMPSPGSVLTRVLNPASSPVGPTVPTSPAVDVSRQQVFTPHRNRIKSGKTVKLATVTDAGQTIRWKSKTPRVCKVTNGKVRTLRAGKCRLQATAEASGEWVRLAQGTVIRVRS